MASWPMLCPVSLFGMSLYGHRSLPQMHARTTRRMASVGSRIDGSGTSSTRTSPAPYMMVARISHLPVVLIVGDLLEPLDGFAVERLLNREVRHRHRRRGAVPVLLVGADGDDVARPDLFDRFAPALVQPAAGGDDQRLPERMRVPVAAGAGLERDVRAAGARRRVRLKQRIDPNGAGEVLRRCLLRGLRAASFDLHASSS